MYERLEKIINMYDVQPHGHELSTSTHYINGDNTQLNNSETMLLCSSVQSNSFSTNFDAENVLDQILSALDGDEEEEPIAPEEEEPVDALDAEEPLEEPGEQEELEAVAERIATRVARKIQEVLWRRIGKC